MGMVNIITLKKVDFCGFLCRFWSLCFEFVTHSKLIVIARKHFYGIHSEWIKWFGNFLHLTENFAIYFLQLFTRFSKIVLSIIPSKPFPSAHSFLGWPRKKNYFLFLSSTFNYYRASGFEFQPKVS